MNIKPIKTRLFEEGDDLFVFTAPYLKKLKDCSVVVVTSKIVALAEKRTAEIKQPNTKEKLIMRESEIAIPTKHVWLTIKDGVVMASAGIDESNGNGKLILLPKNCFRSAELLRKKLQKKYQLKKIGVLITDSRTAPLRAGVTGVALGYAGFNGIKEYRGKADIFGRRFKFSRVNVADSLASAAVLTMGEGNEQRPLAVIQNPPIKFCNKIKRRELYINKKEDMYLPFFKELIT